MDQPLKRTAVQAFKLLVPVVLVVWLLYTLDPKQVEQLAERDKNWLHLSLSVGLILSGVLISFYRWYLILHSIGIQFRRRDAIRLGFLGYFFNFVMIGSVGGDLFKAVFIAREQPTRRAEVVASVVVDRVIGLLALLVLTSIAIIIFDFRATTVEIQMVCWGTLGCTAVGVVGLALLMIPAVTNNPLVNKLTTIPRAGRILKKLMDAWMTVRGQPQMLIKIISISFCIHGLTALGVIGIATSLFDNPPTPLEHLIIVPLSNVASSIPISPAGLGTFEIAMDELYKYLPKNPTDASGRIVAFGFRIATIVVALVGVVVYWFSKQDFDRVLARAKSDEEK
ncbi:MAG TPA: flippase-like domain-containing protein [Planctomycetes bacterium]|nr:flippase-like domain-containing protein [Planctomycetota bacterium]